MSLKRFFLAIFMFLPLALFAKKHTAQELEQKKIDKEEEHYQKARANHPDDARTYWDHARVMLEFKSQAHDARVFYEKALTLDSTNPKLLTEFGEYLYERLFALDDAKAILQKALFYHGDEQEIKENEAKIDKSLSLRQNETTLRDFGHCTICSMDTNKNYAALTNFDSLKNEILDPGSRYFYIKLLTRFLNDDATLTPADMYMLMLGYTNSPYYSPFNYTEISAFKMIVASNQDTAISRSPDLITKYPINPTLNRELMYCYRKKGDQATAEKFRHRMQLFFEGMMYSGNGTCIRPYVSIWGKEEYNFIAYLGDTPTDSHFMETCAGQMAEKIQSKIPGATEKKDFYFNVRLIYMQATHK